MIRSQHSLIHAKDAGNGYHGYCEHCGLPLATDLGYCSWDNTVCDSGPSEERERQRLLDAEVSSVIEIAFEYFRFLRNWGKEFDREGWAYIRGTADPQFMEVKKARRKYKFDTYSEDLIKYILWHSYISSDDLTLKKNKLVFKESYIKKLHSYE